MSKKIDCFFSGKNKGMPVLRPNMRKEPYRSDIENGVKCRSDQGRMMKVLIIPPIVVFGG